MYNLVYYDTPNTFPGNSLKLIKDYKIFNLIKLTKNQNKSEWENLISIAHIYQINASRDEVPIELQVNFEFLKKARNLTLVSSSGSGVDPIDIKQCSNFGILVVNQAGGNSEAVAEHCISMIISLLKRISELDRHLRVGWEGSRKDFIGQNLYSKNIGLIGLGNVGKKMAEICNLAFKCKVMAYDPYVDDKIFKLFKAKRCSLEEILTKSDIISVHVPLTPETKNMFNKNIFKMMKKGSIFITSARGSIHNEKDLFDSLDSGHISGAGLDVWQTEPPNSNNPLLKLQNVIATPHMAGVTIESRNKMGKFVSKQIYDLFNGKPPSRPINKEIIPTFNSKIKMIKN